MAKFLLEVFLLLLITGAYLTRAEDTCPCGGVCPEGWREWGGHCYLKISGRTWQEAIAECHRLDSYMAVPHSKEETDFLQSIQNYFWINCMDIYKEGEWECCDGTKTDYRNWGPGEPNNSGNEDCATVQSSGRWNDINCKAIVSSFCKKPAECLH